MAFKILYSELSSFIPKPESHIDNSFALIDKIKNLVIPHDHVLISLDVTSLFTNIPCNLVLDSLDKRFRTINSKCKIPFDLIRRTTEFLFDNTFFTFNNKFYRQIFGTPMGSPISPLFADLVMEDLEISCLGKLKRVHKYSPLFYFRYVDDTILCVRKDLVDIILNIFNDYVENLKFTHELEEDGSINFLDMSIIRDNGKLITNWYRKSSSSDRVLNFRSNHSIQLKRNIVFNLIDRAVLLSHEKYHEDNIRLVKKILINNNYEKKFIDKYICQRIHKIKYGADDNVIDRQDSTSEENPISFTLSIPYNEDFFRKCVKALKPLNVCTIPYFNKKLDRIVKLGKDVTLKFDQPGVVYKLICKSVNCLAVYVGETKRHLQERIKDHQGRDKKSAVYQHCCDTSHDMDWDNTVILDRELIYMKRIISETLHISDNENLLNKKGDCYSLSRLYTNFMKSISR